MYVSVFTANLRYVPDVVSCCPFPRQPELSEDRTAIVLEAYDKLDQSGDGMVTLEDVKGHYDASHHPKVLEGEMSEDDVLTKFLGRFEGTTKHDGKVGAGAPPVIIISVTFSHTHDLVLFAERPWHHTNEWMKLVSFSLLWLQRRDTTGYLKS